MHDHCDVSDAVILELHSGNVCTRCSMTEQLQNLEQHGQWLCLISSLSRVPANIQRLPRKGLELTGDTVLTAARSAERQRCACPML
jgi:hypothetical protein